MYDVIVVGAGPAGAQCARSLSQQGVKVLILERFANFYTNNFSSGGSIYSILDDFQLPHSTVATTWNQLAIHSASESAQWKTENDLGVIFEFAKLREFLTHDAMLHGAELLMDHQYVSHEIVGEIVRVVAKARTEALEKHFQCKLLVDATGAGREISNPQYKKNKDYTEAVGLEYLLEIPNCIHDQKTISFFLGPHWIQNGYGWIFPNGGITFKVGAIFIKDKQRPAPLLHPAIKKLLTDFLKVDAYRLLDKHGGIVIRRPLKKEPYFHGKVCGIGDAVSTINMLGYEGIRHAMQSARYAAESIMTCLQDKPIFIKKYKKQLFQYYGWRWHFSNFAAQIVYLHLNAKQIEGGVRRISKLNTEQIIGILFHYRLLSVVLQLLLK